MPDQKKVLRKNLFIVFRHMKNTKQRRNSNPDYETFTTRQYHKFRTISKNTVKKTAKFAFYDFSTSAKVESMYENVAI
jgi:hypothetical protein|tara:strand:- start:905 stop:1138 length:234 start_codon:yes stop_codon:yes gene_type:complete